MGSCRRCSRIAPAVTAIRSCMSTVWSRTWCNGPTATFVAIDAHPLHVWLKAAGTIFQSELQRQLTARLGVAWGPERNGCRDTRVHPRPAPYLLQTHGRHRDGVGGGRRNRVHESGADASTRHRDRPTGRPLRAMSDSGRARDSAKSAFPSCRCRRSSDAQRIAAVGPFADREGHVAVQAHDRRRIPSGSPAVGRNTDNTCMRTCRCRQAWEQSDSSHR